MGEWNAPQWTDFDASVMSDIDEYFNTVHDELESAKSSDAQYRTCPSTPNSDKSGFDSPYKTPNASSNGTSEELASYMKNLQMKSEKKILKGKSPMTPKSLLMKKACMRLKHSSTPLTPGKLSGAQLDTAPKSEEPTSGEDEAPKVIDTAPTPETSSCVAVCENSGDTEEDKDKEDPNNTLIASEGKEEDCLGEENPIRADAEVLGKVSLEAGTKVCLETQSDVRPETQRDLSVVAQSKVHAQEQIDVRVAAQTNSRVEAPGRVPSDDPGKVSVEARMESSEKTVDSNTAVTTNGKIKISDGPEKEKPLVLAPSKNSEIIRESASMRKAAQVSTKSAKSSESEKRLDPSERKVAENKKKCRVKSTVLTSHARRQSTAKYRRVSNKYVSLAEAVSKFQNGTPERFRSCNNKVAKGSNAPGALHRVKQAALRVTYATSPLLRCKYRTRPVSVPTQEERELMEMEEARKNRIKPNPIKPSIMNPSKNLKTTTTLAESRVKATNAAFKKVEEKPVPVTQSARQKIATIPAIPKKITEPAKTELDSSPRRVKSMMNPPMPLDKKQKPTSASNLSTSSTRRTMMNPPKSTLRNTEPATIAGASSTSRRTMMNRGLPLTETNNALTKFSEPLIAIPKTKTTFKPPAEIVKKIEAQSKSLIESFITMDKKKDTSILPNSTLSESARKHTPCKKTVPSVVSTDQGIALQNVEILHFGIPVGTDYKRITKPQPFSFETRQKELQNKREKLKGQKFDNEEDKKLKTFHARPAPSYIAKPPSNGRKTLNKPLVISDAPFSFHQRNEITLKKKKEMFDQIVEREKQARVFHAKPAPTFKPVFVRGASAENLRVNNPTEKGTTISKQRALSQSSMINNCENTAPNVVANNQPFPKMKNPLMTQYLRIKKTAM